MDFGGAGDPLIFFGPLRGAVGEPGAHHAHTTRTPGAHQAHTRRTAQNRGSARRSPTEGAPLRVCRGLQLAPVPWTLGGRGPLAPGGREALAPGGRVPLAPGRQGIPPPLVISRILPPRWSSHGYALGGPLVISRICPGGALGHLTDSPPGIPGFRSRFWASSRGFPRKFLDGMAQN